MDTLPWYRQPWPWFLIALPATADVGGIITAVIAVRTNDGLVEADYYKRGLEINRELSRSKRAIELGLAADLAAQGLRAGDRVTLRITARAPLPADATLQLRLVHPGRAQADHLVVLARTGSSRDGREAQYAGAWREDVAARGADAPLQWVVAASTWRLDGDVVRSKDGLSMTARAVAQ
jgi:hypothetical protein